MNKKEDKADGISGDTLILNVAILTAILPFILAFNTEFLFPWDHQQPSLSDYVYTTTRPVFYGLVYTLGVIMFFYHGYPQNNGPIPLTDNQLANLSGLCLVITATFPTSHCFSANSEPINFFRSEFWSGLHAVGAFMSYFTIALFSLFYFTQSNIQNPSHLGQNKRIRNRIHRICGVVVMLCLSFLIYKKIMVAIGDQDACFLYNRFSYIFHTETIMNLAIAISWGLKFYSLKQN